MENFDEFNIISILSIAPYANNRYLKHEMDNIKYPNNTS